MNDPIIGIDLGTTNSAVAIVQDGVPRILDKDGQRIIPSVVSYAPETGWLVGQPALNQYTLNPENTIRSIKRHMGSETRIKVGKWELSPQEISAFILRELKSIAESYLGQPVEKAVITVPAYFSNAQRQATQAAGEIAGLEVVRIINEPTAAALAYGLDNDDDEMALVYDLGGGTFDVSVVEMTGGVVEVVASHGDTALGGDDFDRVLAEHLGKIFYKQHGISLADNRLAMARLDRAAEAAKVRLSNFAETHVSAEYLAETGNISRHLDTTMTRETFQTMTESLLQRTLESLETVFKDAEFSTDNLNRILLAGGSTRMPAVWDLVSEYTGLEPDAEINPDEVVALGAAVQAAIIAGLPVNSILVDVTPYSLGIETATEVRGQIIPDIYSVLIHRNTTIPVTKEQTFYAIHSRQTTVHIKVYQGEAPIASDNILLGDFLIEGLQPATPGELPSVNVRFDFDVNGMLHVRATDRATGKTKSVSVQATQARLSPAQIAEARQRLETLADDAEPSAETAAPTTDAETQALLHRAQTLLDEGSLAEPQATRLKSIVQDIKNVATQPELDDLAEELLDMLFELE